LPPVGPPGVAAPVISTESPGSISEHGSEAGQPERVGGGMPGSQPSHGVTMYALDAATGTILWSFASGGSVTGGAAIGRHIREVASDQDSPRFHVTMIRTECFHAVTAQSVPMTRS
jgi:hypothetical protein